MDKKKTNKPVLRVKHGKDKGKPINIREPKTVIIEKKYQLWEATTKDDLRPMLQNIKVGTDKEYGKYAVATDGKILALVPAEFTGGKVEEIIPAKVVQDSAKLNAPICIDDAQFRVQNHDSTGTIYPKPVLSGEYPNWSVALPDNPEQYNKTISFDAIKLMRLAKAIGATEEFKRWNSDKGALPVTLSFNDAASAIVVRATNGMKSFGLLMPMRPSELPAKWPISKPQQKQETKKPKTETHEQKHSRNKSRRS